MADRVYEIEFRTTVVGAGAEKMQADLRDVGEAASTANAQIQGSGGPLDELRKQLEATKQEANRVAEELNNVAGQAKPTAESIDNAAESTRQFTADVGGSVQGLQGLYSQLNSGGTSAQGWTKSLSAATSATGGLMTNLIGVTGVIGGFIAAISMVEDASRSFANWLLSMDKSVTDTTSALEKMESVRLDMADQKKSIQDFIADVQQAISETKEFERVANKFRDQQAKTERARIEGQARKDIAAAGGDKNAEAAIRARADAQLAALDGTRATEKVDSDLALIKREMFLLEQQKLGLEQRSTEAASRYASASEYIAQISEELGVSFSDALRLGKNTEKLNKAINDATTLDQKSQLQSLGEAAKNRGAAQQVLNERDRELPGIATKLELLATKMETLLLRREEEQLKQDTKAIDLGADSQKALMSLTDAIREQQKRVSDAQSLLGAAQRDLSPSAGLKQNAAYANLTTEQGKLSTLQQQFDQAKAAIEEGNRLLGDAHVLGAESVKNSAVEGAGKINQAADGAKAAVDKAATQFTIDAESAIGKVDGSVQQLGSVTAQSFEMVAKSVENVAVEVVQRMRSLESRLASAEASATRAESTANRTAAQVRNAR